MLFTALTKKGIPKYTSMQRAPTRDKRNESTSHQNPFSQALAKENPS